MAEILIIDDDPQILRVLRSILEREGYAVREAANGKTAMALLEEAPPDLVVSDMYMPEMDGIEFLIRVQDLYPGLGIVAMSGGGFMAKEELLSDAFHLGAIQVLAKPFTWDDVVGVVRRALGK